jgi:uncharacterized protein DUF6056
VTVASPPASPAVVRTSPSKIEVLFGVALALPLLVYSAVGAFSRYTADDFCWGGILRTQGFVNSQVHWYTEYSPRYAFSFLVNVTELVGPAIVPALPFSAIAIWLAVLTWTLTQFGIRKLRGLILAEVAVLGTLQTAPDLPQSLYWQTGLLTYVLPLVLATCLIGWVRRDLHRNWAYFISAALTFIAGGLAETYLIPQNVALTLALLLALRYRTRRAHLVAALVGGVVALAVIVASPSIGGRVMGTPADLRLASSAAVATAAFQVIRLIRFFPFTVVLCLAASAVLGGGAPRIDRRSFFIVTAVVLVTLPFCDFPSFFAQNGNPPARSLIVPGAIMIGYIIFVGLTLREIAAHWLPARRRDMALAALGLVPLITAIVALPDVAAAANYAALFDAEDQQIRASRGAGQQDLTVSRLPTNLGEEFVGPDRDNFFNMCVARYYGLRSIAAPAAS